MRRRTEATEFALLNVHDPSECEGRHCIIHNPVSHHMSKWPLTLRPRGNTVLWERICHHGVGHPDPSQYDYWVEECREYESVHACDGCCSE